MNRFVVLLSAWLLAIAGFSAPLRAQSANGNDAQGDYVRMAVPDLPQAVAFFRDVMNCTLLSSAETADPAQHDALALVDCSPDAIVELSSGNQAASRKPAPPIVFAVNDAAAAAAWLRSHHIAVLAPHPEAVAGKLVVNFLAPWGQPLQLVGPAASSSNNAARQAAQ